MAKTVKPRNKKYNPHHARVSGITYVINQALGKFSIMGDQHHKPMSFHISDVRLKLKGQDLKTALGQVTEFLFGKRQPWTVLVYHIFKYGDDSFQVVPVSMVIPDITLGLVGDLLPALIEESKAVVLETEGFEEEAPYYHFYSYYINYGEINISGMEPDLISAFFKVNSDFSEQKEIDIELNGFAMADCIADEKFSPVDSNAKVSDFMELTPEIVLRLSELSDRRVSQ